MSIKTPVSHLMLGVLFLELCIVVPGLGQTLVNYDGTSVYERDKMNQVLLDEINWYRTNPKSYQKALNADNESWDEKIKVKKKKVDSIHWDPTVCALAEMVLKQNKKRIPGYKESYILRIDLMEHPYRFLRDYLETRYESYFLLDGDDYNFGIAFEWLDVEDEFDMSRDYFDEATVCFIAIPKNP